MIHEINDIKEFNTRLERGIAVVDFYADWCGPCKKIAPELERISGIYTSVTFLKVDVDAFEDLCSQFSVTAMPTFIVFKDGVEEGRFLGGNFSVIEKLQTKIDSL
jgi:thioredoxin 1